MSRLGPLAASSGARRHHRLLCVVMGCCYFFVSFALPLLGKSGLSWQRILYGFSQLRWLGLPLACAGVASPLLVMFVAARLPPEVVDRLRAALRRLFSSLFFRLGLAGLMILVFFSLRNEYVNQDGLAFEVKFPIDVPVKGSHVTHDEMWEFYLHSRLWHHAHANWGWSVKLCYQVLSSAAGGLFVFLLMSYCLVVLPHTPVSAFLLCVSGGYMQLFFGDVENYTLTAMWIMGYFLASLLFIKKKTSIIAPSVLLSVALTFHLLSGFLVPSLLYLYVLAARRGARASLALGGAAFAGILGLTLLFFHYRNLPIRDLWYNSHACGHGGDILRMLVHPSLRYYFELFNLAVLLVPAFVLLIPLLAYRRIRQDEVNMHLLIGSIFMAAFVLVWQSYLGVYEDWNLFAAAAIPISLLVWRNALADEDLPGKRFVFFLGWLFFMHSYSWILSNHG